MKIISSFLRTTVLWFDSSSNSPIQNNSNKINWLRLFPFILLHLACLTVFLVGVSTTAVLTLLLLYFIRMFAITGFYHRYFSHRAFKTSRLWQFIFAILGASAVQRGPLWWAAHHRKHHLTADKAEDPHSPHIHGFWWSHCGWFMADENFSTDYQRVNDLNKFPELVFINRFDILVPFFLALSLLVLGNFLHSHYPALHTNGWQLVVWGFCLSTVLVYHATFAINSLAHCHGKRIYETKDKSRNNFLLALITLGEGWHNNHHRFPGSARQGFQWWQIDITFYLLKILQWLHIIHDLKPVPPHKINQEVVTWQKKLP